MSARFNLTVLRMFNRPLYTRKTKKTHPTANKISRGHRCNRNKIREP